MPTDLKRARRRPEGGAHGARATKASAPINWLAFNTAKKPLSDVAVRKAIATAIDKNFITKVLMGGFARRRPTARSCRAARSRVADLVRYPFDLKKAAEMLDAAGYKAGADGERFKLTIDYLPGVDDQQKNVAEYIRGQLKKVGIAVEVRASADFPAWAKRMATHDFDMSMDIVFNWGDPVIGVAPHLPVDQHQADRLDQHPVVQQPEGRRAAQHAPAAILDPTKRKAYYATFEKIVTDELPIDFINVIPYHTATQQEGRQRADDDLGADVAATTRC